MDTDRRSRARLAEHRRASESGDIEVEHAIYAVDTILDYPQSGERFRGRGTIQAQRPLPTEDGEAAPPPRRPSDDSLEPMDARDA